MILQRSQCILIFVVSDAATSEGGVRRADVNNSAFQLFQHVHSLWILEVILLRFQIVMQQAILYDITTIS